MKTETVITETHSAGSAPLGGSARQFTTNAVYLQGTKWQVLEWMEGKGSWDDATKEFAYGWDQVGPYYDTEAEAESAITAMQAQNEKLKNAGPETPDVRES